MPDPFGFLNVDKPAGMTSHDVINKIRRGLRVKKVGHAGTLDPMATGVLVVCLGMATRLSEYVMPSTKGYRARVYLGNTTDTYDADGDTLTERDATHITRDAVAESLVQFTGQIDQLPPMYSAIKKDGKKLYELAREGKTIERDPRSITIYDLTLIDWQPPEFTLDVVCSAGTYIRSLAYDIGETLGVGAHLSGLIRTASGAFHVDSAVSLDALLGDSEWMRHIVPVEDALPNLPAVHLDESDVVHVQHGRNPQSVPAANGDDYACAYTPQGKMIAILRADDGQWRPHKVFLSK